MEKTIGIISLGWLGLSLYEFLNNKNFKTIGTYHSSKKNVDYQIKYDFNHQDIPKELLDLETIFFNLPPSSINSLKNFTHFIQQLNHQKLIFISSTSVYGDQGNVDERTVLKANSKNGEFLSECETIITNHLKDFSIIRPGGLYGKDRHPGKYLSGKKDISGGNHPINLTGLDDLLEVIQKVLNNPVPILNAVNTNHPAKKEYYQSYCQKMGLDLPSFCDDENQSKIVSSIYSNYSFDTQLP